MGKRILISRLYNHLRRAYLFRFRKSYVNRSLSLRRGKCPPNCGACCLSALRSRPCPHLDSDMRCSIYPDRKCLRPFPIDEKEKKLFGIADRCGYYWKQK